MSHDKSEIDLLTEISAKLDSILGLLATRGIEDDPGAIVNKLHGMALSPRVIAPIAGLSENAVSVRITRMRKKSPAKAK